MLGWVNTISPATVPGKARPAYSVRLSSSQDCPTALIHHMRRKGHGYRSFGITTFCKTHELSQTQLDVLYRQFTVMTSGSSNVSILRPPTVVLSLGTHVARLTYASTAVGCAGQMSLCGLSNKCQHAFVLPLAPRPPISSQGSVDISKNTLNYTTPDASGV